MKRLRIFLFIFCLSAALLVRPAALRAQQFALSEPAGRTAELRAEVEFLCDSLCAGRGFGTAGAQGATLYLLRQLRNAGLRTTVQSFAAGGRVGHNVVAVTPGWFRRYIVVGAYFDGLGMLDGRLYPGADANASRRCCWSAVSPPRCWRSRGSCLPCAAAWSASSSWPSTATPPTSPAPRPS